MPVAEWENEPKGERDRPPGGKTLIGYGDDREKIVVLFLSDPAEQEAWREFWVRLGYVVRGRIDSYDSFISLDDLMRTGSLTYVMTDQVQNIATRNRMFGSGAIPTLILIDEDEMDKEGFFDSLDVAGLITRSESGDPSQCDMLINPNYEAPG